MATMGDAPPAVGSQPFCEDHWDDLVPDIRDGSVNGIALQPLAIEAGLGHEDAVEEFGPEPLDVEEVLPGISPICCWLEGRTAYTADSGEFEDDYGVLVETGTTPLEDEPDEWWVNREGGDA